MSTLWNVRPYLSLIPVPACVFRGKDSFILSTISPDWRVRFGWLALIAYVIYATSLLDVTWDRFVLGLEQGVRFVMECLERMHGGELFVPKIPSMKVTDLAAALAPEASIRVVGIRPGEKLHEEMISGSDSRRTVDMGDYYVIQPEMDWWPDHQLDGAPVEDGFSYASDTNSQWLTVDELRAMVASV